MLLKFDQFMIYPRRVRMWSKYIGHRGSSLNTSINHTHITNTPTPGGKENQIPPRVSEPPCQCERPGMIGKSKGITLKPRTFLKTSVLWPFNLLPNKYAKKCWVLSATCSLLVKHNGDTVSFYLFLGQWVSQDTSNLNRVTMSHIVWRQEGQWQRGTAHLCTMQVLVGCCGLWPP